MNNDHDCVCEEELDDSKKELEELEARMRKAIESGDTEEAEIVYWELQLYAAKKAQDQERISKIEKILKNIRTERDGRKRSLEGPPAAPEGKAGGTGAKGEKGVDAKKGPPSKIKKDCCGKRGKPAR